MRKIAKYTRVWASLQVALIVQMKHAKKKYGSLLENSLYTMFEKMCVNAKVFFVIFACLHIICNKFQKTSISRKNRETWSFAV